MNNLWPKLKEDLDVYIGTDYYPEHWPEERWAEDAQLMKEAGFNVVRLAEFAWSLLEPSQGQFDFTWLDRAIENLNRFDIKAVLGTPTPTPPPWLAKTHPDILPVDADGRVRQVGSRRHYCLNSETYHEHTGRIVRAMAGHYRDHEAIIGWQIDNEFGCHDTARCYCPRCQAGFHRWLHDKYGDLDRLNQAWGTVFWSQKYSEWDEIPLPWPSPASRNPSLELDFARFSSDTNVRYQKLQVDIIREICPSHFVTHNMMGMFADIDYFDLARDLDFVSWDNYPSRGPTIDHAKVSLAHDIMRGMKKRNFWVMEQMSGPGGQRYLGATPHPGHLRLWTYQAVARGAEGIVYFRWRTCPFGAEENWHGILDHHGEPGRRYEEIKQTVAELQSLGDVFVTAPVQAEAAIVRPYDDIWATRAYPAAFHYDYDEELLKYYRALYADRVTTDIVDASEDIEGYRLVVAPSLHLVSEEMVSKFKRFVEAGGTLVLGYRSGVKTLDNQVIQEPLPGLLRELMGARISEYTTFGSYKPAEQRVLEKIASHSDTHATVSFVDPDFPSVSCFGSTWCDVLEPVYARPLAVYTDHYFQGKAAITENRYGKGRVIYVGTGLGSDGMQILMSYIRNHSGVSTPLPASPGLEITQKVDPSGRELLTVLNHRSQPGTLYLDKQRTDLLTEESLERTVNLEGYGVLVLV